MESEAIVCGIPCNLCEAFDAEEICTVDRDRNHLRTVICRNCGLVWTDPRPNQAEIENYYSKDYRIKYKGTHTPRLKHIYRAGMVAKHRYLFLKDIIRPDDIILDVGSGGGEFVYFLRSLGFDASGIEPNEGYAVFARDQLKMPIQVGLVQQHDLPESSFDIITMHHVFEHLDDPFRILTKLRKALRDGGIIVIEVPNVEARCYAPIHRFHAAHLYNFNPVTLESMGRRAGFSVERSVVSPDGGVITTIFRKGSGTAELEDLSSNYRRVRDAVDNHSTFSHYLTSNPYLRPFHRLRARLSEKSAIRDLTNGTEVLDSIVTGHKNEAV